MKSATTERVKINPENGVFMDIGFGFVVNTARVTCIMPFIGNMVERLYKNRRDDGMFFDATRGRAKRSLILLDNGEIIGSAFKPDTIINRQL